MYPAYSPRWPIFLISLLLFFFQTSQAQFDEKDFVRYTVKNGLSDNYITSFLQDDRGYIWIGTDAGLNRFDGHSFNNFQQGTPGLPLASSGIRNLKKFGPHQLGIITLGGFQLLNTNNFSLRNYFIPGISSFNQYLNSVWDVELSGNTYLLSTAAGVYELDTAGTIRFRYDAYKPEDARYKHMRYGRDIFPLNEKDRLIYFEEHGLAHYNTATRSFHPVLLSEKEWEPFNHPGRLEGEAWAGKYQINRNEFLFIYRSKDSMVYYNHQLNKRFAAGLPLRTGAAFNWESKLVMLNDSLFAINDAADGFYIFQLDRKNGKILQEPKKFLPSYKVNCLFIDKDNRLWVGTSRGVLQQKLNTPFLNSFSFPFSPADTLTGGFSSIYRHKDKLFLSRFSRRHGLLIADTATMKTKKQISFYGNDNMWNEIRTIQMYHPDTLWLGTNGGILWFDTKTNHYGKVTDDNNPQLSEFSAILAPPTQDGYAWISNYLSGAVARYHIATRTFTIFTSQTQPTLPFDRVKSIVYDSYGDVWIGGHSLARWNTRKQLFDTLIKVYGGFNKFNDDILTISADVNGSLWLHNAFNGLLEYRIKNKEFIPYTMNDGLPAMDLRSFSPVINNMLWIGCNNTLVRFDTRTKKSIVFNQQDGLPEHRPTSRWIYFDTASRFFYLLCNTEVVKFPLQLRERIDKMNDLMVQKLVVNNRHTFFHPADELRLKPAENNLSLHFTIIDFEQSDNYEFAYKLNDSDNWISLGQQRNINLTGLSSGHYSIQLRANNKTGIHTQGEFKFSIAPPFWQTSWFLISCSLLVAGSLYYLYRTRIKQIRKRANIDKQLSQAEMKALHAQMNPHFIFNSLNSIREMILNNEDKEASHFLGKFAHLIRMTLDQSGQPFISLRNTMDYLTRYIEMEQIRNAHFTFRILADDELDLDETILPPMLIQPFIENAIWHGTTGERKNININIDFKKSTDSGPRDSASGEDNQLVCIIDDNGIGIEQSLKNKKESGNNHHPVGITNIKNRIRLLNEKHNLQSSVTIQDKNGLKGYTETGTLVILRLPLETTDNE